MKATLSVRMENDSMLTGSDLAWLLDQAAARLRREVQDDRVSIRDGFALRDINGQGVGRLDFAEEFEIVDEEDMEDATFEAAARAERAYERHLENQGIPDDQYVGPTYREYED